MILKGLLEQAIASTPPDSWPTYDGMELDRTEFLTSSQVATCLRQSYFEKHAKQFPHEGFRGNGYTERGHAIEAWLVSKLLLLQVSGYKFHYVGKNQRSFYDPDLGLSGTPDGVLEFPNGVKVLLEFKSIDPRTNTNNLPRRKHVLQTQQNIYLVRKCLGWDINEAILFYIDASDVFNTHEFPITYDEKEVQLCKQRAELLWEAEGPEDLEPEGILTGDCEYCQAFRHCSAYVGVKKMLEAAGAGSGNFLLPPVGELTITEEEILLIERFLILRDDFLSGEKELEKVKLLVKEIVSRLGGGFIIHDKALTYREEPGKVTIDKDAMIKAGLDPKDYEKVGRPYGVLTVGKPKR